MITGLTPEQERAWVDIVDLCKDGWSNINVWSEKRRSAILAVDVVLRTTQNRPASPTRRGCANELAT